jgi:hypothetical protein
MHGLLRQEGNIATESDINADQPMALNISPGLE